MVSGRALSGSAVGGAVVSVVIVTTWFFGFRSVRTAVPEPPTSFYFAGTDPASGSELRLRVQSRAAPSGSESAAAYHAVVDVTVEIMQPSRANTSDWTIWRSELKMKPTGNGRADAAFFAIRSADPSQWTCVSDRDDMAVPAGNDQDWRRVAHDKQWSFAEVTHRIFRLPIAMANTSVDTTLTFSSGNATTGPQLEMVGGFRRTAFSTDISRYQPFRPDLPRPRRAPGQCMDLSKERAFALPGPAFQDVDRPGPAFQDVNLPCTSEALRVFAMEQVYTLQDEFVASNQIKWTPFSKCQLTCGAVGGFVYAAGDSAMLCTYTPPSAPASPQTWVVFAGSNNNADWLNNANVLYQWYIPAQMNVHSGFVNEWSALRTRATSMLLDHMDRGGSQTVVVMGHSMGGAVANLAAIEWKNNHRISVQLTTIGAPALFQGLTESYRQIPNLRLVTQRRKPWWAIDTQDPASDSTLIFWPVLQYQHHPTGLTCLIQRDGWTRTTDPSQCIRVLPLVGWTDVDLHRTATYRSAQCAIHSQTC